MATLQSKSPAEFFAEHQNIAGFDNPGKSLYTTIREFVENSLDAAENISALPDIEITVEKLTTEEFNSLRGIDSRKRKDHLLYDEDDNKGKRKKSSKAEEKEKEKKEKEKEKLKGEGDPFGLPDAGTETAKPDEKAKGKDKGLAYFRVTCKDNGMGMSFDDIPNMLGIVLSSTKYGVQQTRGKFGLGAKMALVWSKKSTGLPIEVLSAPKGQKITYCKLDIDIHKNQPRVLVHEHRDNSQNWRGTQITVVISGNWTSYQSKVLNYMRQLAVITPYARFLLRYRDNSNDKKSYTLQFKRRTDVMPAPPKPMKHHPSSVNNLLVEQLIHYSPTTTLLNFLSKEFSSIKPSLAARLIEELGSGFEKDTPVRSMSKQQIHQITTLLREAKFPKPPADCLSPAGEYNLRLGIIKEIQPDIVATYAEQPCVLEGHPFVVEAAVSIGGARAKPGISVYRFANRIPLLFEPGSDVTAIVANRSIRWLQYKIKNTDKVGVFVSIVSTKIPFKGTSKEYIGDDKGILHETIKHAIAQCCIQLKKRISTLNLMKTRGDRKKTMVRYIPDVSRALNTLLELMNDSETGSIALGALAKTPSLARPGADAQARELLGKVGKEVSEDSIASKLHLHVDQIDTELALDYVTTSGRMTGDKDSICLAPYNSGGSEDAVRLWHPECRMDLPF